MTEPEPPHVDVPAEGEPNGDEQTSEGFERLPEVDPSGYGPDSKPLDDEHVEDIDVPGVPEPDQPDPGEMDPADDYREGARSAARPVVSATGTSTSRVASSWRTASPTNSSSVQSPTVSSWTTSAATSTASTPPTWSR